MAVKVTVSNHAIDRFMTRFPYLARGMTREEAARFLERMYKRAKLDGRWDLSERRRKGQIFLVAALTPDGHGSFDNRCLTTVYRGRYKKQTPDDPDEREAG